MANIKIFYGSTTGNTERTAELIKAELEQSGKVSAAVFNIADTDIKEIEEADFLILGTSTWYTGELQDDWTNFYPKIDQLNLNNKKIALFGLGDQVNYSEYFLNGIGILAEKIKKNNGEIVGYWPVEGYDFSESLAVIDNKFAGLAIDESNQPELTRERVKKWVKQIIAEAGL